MKTLTARRSGMRRAICALAAALAVSGAFAANGLAEHPNDRAGMLGPGAAQVVSVAPERPDDRGGIRGPGGLTPAQVALPSVTAHDGFQWGDATLGAIAMLGAVFAAGVLALAVRKRGHLAST